MLPALIKHDPVLELIESRLNELKTINEYFIFSKSLKYHTHIINRCIWLLDYIKEHKDDKPDDILKSNDYRLLCDWL